MLTFKIKGLLIVTGKKIFKDFTIYWLPFCSCDLTHNENTPMQNNAIFHGYKNVNFQLKNYDIFLIFSSKH